MVPSAAALMGLVGTMPTSQFAKDGSSGRCTTGTPDRMAVAAAGSMTRPRKSTGATRAVMVAITASITKKTTKAREPSRPIVPGVAADTATMSDDTMSGMTVMRIAFTHMMPMGSM